MSRAMPLQFAAREARYAAQNHGRALTPRQSRRLKHKRNKAIGHGAPQERRAAA